MRSTVERMEDRFGSTMSDSAQGEATMFGRLAGVSCHAFDFCRIAVLPSAKVSRSFPESGKADLMTAQAMAVRFEEQGGVPMTNIRPPLRGWWIAIVFLSAAVLLAFLPHIAQDENYHVFADQRALLSVPNFWNLVSNLPFAIVGILGLWRLRSATSRVLFAGLLLTCFGSGYYHFAPNDARLVWDRLPMTLVFMSFLAAVIAEGRSSRWVAGTLGLLLFLGVTSVWWWQTSGNLRPYLLVQFGPVLVMLPAFWRAIRKRWLWGVAALYAAAKVVELYDRLIYSVLPLSGHTWKHLLGAVAGYCILRWFCERSQTVTRPSGNNVV